MRTTANVGFIAFFFLLCGVAAVQEKEEPNFAAAKKHRAGCICAKPLSDCFCAGDCYCLTDPELDPKPEPEDDPLPVPIDPPPDDDVGPSDDDDRVVQQERREVVAFNLSDVLGKNEDGSKRTGKIIYRDLTRREVIMHSRDNCPPCDSWWANERPKFEAAGWVVALHVLRPDENGRTPFFTVEANGKQIEHQGWLTVERAKGLVK